MSFLTIGSPFSFTSVSFHRFSSLFEHFIGFWHKMYVPGSSCTFSVLALELARSLRIPIPLGGEQYLKIKLCLLYVLIVNGVSLLLVDRGRKYMCIYLYWFCWSLNMESFMFSPTHLILVQRHRIYPSFLPFHRNLVPIIFIIFIWSIPWNIANLLSLPSPFPHGATFLSCLGSASPCQRYLHPLCRYPPHAFWTPILHTLSFTWGSHVSAVLKLCFSILGHCSFLSSQSWRPTMLYLPKRKEEGRGNRKGERRGRERKEGEEQARKEKGRRGERGGVERGREEKEKGKATCGVLSLKKRSRQIWWNI